MAEISSLPGAQTDTASLLAVENLNVSFRSGREWLTVVDGVSFSIGRGETVGLVGESGSGKTVTGLSILGLLPPSLGRNAGRIMFEGRNIVGLDEAELQRLRGRRISMIFQEPMTALDPVFTIGDQISETLLTHMKISAREARERSIAALAQVGIPVPERRVDEYPHQLSGGMRQRVMIAIALACEPSLLIADEPTTALDVTIQAQIIDLLLEQVSRRGTSLLFISHNLGVVRQCCSRMVTMYAGQVVEDGVVDDILERPLHPYTSGLLGSHPRHAAHRTRLPSIGGRVPSPGDMPWGCRFASRCRYRVDACEEPQSLIEAGGKRQVRCCRYAELGLPGTVPA